MLQRLADAAAVEAEIERVRSTSGAALRRALASRTRAASLGRQSLFAWHPATKKVRGHLIGSPSVTKV
jgi:hypothetical protein